MGSFDLTNQAKRLINYKLHGYWTPEDQIFDIGRTTSLAIDRLESLVREGREKELADLWLGGREQDNGNGALMRIFPLWAYLQNQPVKEWYLLIWQHSALTHGHSRSALCCFLYLRFCHHLINKEGKVEALKAARQETEDVMLMEDTTEEEYGILQKIMEADFTNLARTQVQGSGYVVHCLEAALWCLFNTDNYRDAVLKAVNLGQDTDTTACVVGAPAALLYGVEAIPANWLAALARQEEIVALGDRLHAAYPR